MSEDNSSESLFLKRIENCWRKEIKENKIVKIFDIDSNFRIVSPFMTITFNFWIV